ncbi:MAG: L-threonylcarbamoyladenylate synthase [Candidatus Binatia bacterium]
MLGSNSGAGGLDSESIHAAARVLAAGGSVVYPTETLYALGVDALNPRALERLVGLKVRTPGKPIAVLISDTSMLHDLVDEVPSYAAVLMRRFWPGPLTLVLRGRPSLSPLLTGGGNGIGVRLSSHATAISLVRTLGRPVTAPSANPAGLRPPTCIEEARTYFGSRVEYYLDGGRVRGEPASTVVDARGQLVVIREGAVTAAALRASLRSAV